jgi:predicted AAA+ superfamily ATPase
MERRYWRRIIDDELDAFLPALPALALEGPKGVGKTATAARRAATVRQLDDPAQLALAAADPARMLEGATPVLLDEWQRAPALWDVVRRAVDQGAPPASYLLAGSAAPIEQPAHSGAGRIATLRMRPMSLAERRLTEPTVSIRALLDGARPALEGRTTVRLADYAEEIIRSGLPGVRTLPPRPLRLQLDAYVARLAERDFEEVGHRVRAPATLLRWMVAYAAATATVATYETIRHAATAGDGAAPSRATTQPYREALERLFLLDPVPGWAPTRSRIARLALPPKHHLADPALAARLLGVGIGDLLEGREVGPPVPRDGTLLGALFESLVTLSVRAYAQAAEAAVAHLRTMGGDHEVDLIVERGGRVVAIEVKLAQAVGDADVRQLRWLADRIGDDLVDSLVVTTGAEAYRRPDGIGVVPAALLGP